MIYWISIVLNLLTKISICLSWIKKSSRNFRGNADGPSQGAFSGSPIVSNEYYFIQNESGTTFVIRPDKDKLEVVAKNQLSNDVEEIFRATLSPIENKIFTRSSKNLYCIVKEK